MSEGHAEYPHCRKLWDGYSVCVCGMPLVAGVLQVPALGKNKIGLSPFADRLGYLLRSRLAGKCSSLGGGGDTTSFRHNGIFPRRDAVSPEAGGLLTKGLVIQGERGRALHRSFMPDSTLCRGCLRRMYKTASPCASFSSGRTAPLPPPPRLMLTYLRRLSSTHRLNSTLAHAFYH